MTQVEFHFGAPDKIAYACRLLRKAVANGAHVAVIAPAATITRLDAALWGTRAIDFVPHCLDAAPDSLLRHSPVVLGTQMQTFPTLINPVLVQLCHPVAQSVHAYARVIEVVSLDEADRAEARQRWKTYRAWGISIEKRDLALKEMR